MWRGGFSLFLTAAAWRGLPLCAQALHLGQHRNQRDAAARGGALCQWGAGPQPAVMDPLAQGPSVFTLRPSSDEAASSRGRSHHVAKIWVFLKRQDDQNRSSQDRSSQHTPHTRSLRTNPLRQTKSRKTFALPNNATKVLL